MAAAGTLQSGGFLYALHKAAAAQVEAYATFSVDEILGTLTRVLGAVPRDSKDWILAVFRTQVGVLATQLADDVEGAEKKMAVQPHSGAELKVLVAKRAEQLSIELDRRILASQHRRRQWVSALLQHPLFTAVVGAIVGALLVLVFSE